VTALVLAPVAAAAAASVGATAAVGTTGAVASVAAGTAASGTVATVAWVAGWWWGRRGRGRQTTRVYVNVTVPHRVVAVLHARAADVVDVFSGRA
jgi:hypothetical protein